MICYLQLPWNEMSQALDNGLSQVRQGEIFGVWQALRNVKEGFGGPPMPELNVNPENLKSWAEANGLNYRVTERVRKVSTQDGPREAIDVQFRARVGKSE